MCHNLSVCLVQPVQHLSEFVDVLRGSGSQHHRRFCEVHRLGQWIVNGVKALLIEEPALYRLGIVTHGSDQILEAVIQHWILYNYIDLFVIYHGHLSTSEKGAILRINQAVCVQQGSRQQPHRGGWVVGPQAPQNVPSVVDENF